MTKLWHDPIAQKIAELARLNGLSASNGIHARPANPNSNIMTDRIISGLLKNGGELHVDVVTTTVTCKSNMTDSAVVDGAAAAKAAAAKITYHRDNILAANPDNRFAPFAVEEGGDDLALTPRPLSTQSSERAPRIRRPGSQQKLTACEPSLRPR